MVAIIGIVLLIIVLAILIKLNNEEIVARNNAADILDGLFISERISEKCKKADRKLVTFKIKHSVYGNRNDH